jgi:hypothetical protein
VITELAGLRDKLYWRRVSEIGLFHCFSSKGDGPHREHRFVSLCGTHTRAKAGGGQMARPPCIMRCAGCDVAEMRRRGVDESMPESKDWRAYHGFES